MKVKRLTDKSALSSGTKKRICDQMGSMHLQSTQKKNARAGPPLDSVYQEFGANRVGPGQIPPYT